MHLKYESRLFATIFLLALVFLSLFIILTMFDTMRRSELYAEAGKPISPYARIYDAQGAPKPLSARALTPAPGRRASAETVAEAPFELRHGYGPIKEEVEVGPLDTVWALRGKQIFETKCASCHKLDERYTGPPLRAVASYRSPTFIMNQILDPAQNVAKHPDMQAMLKVYYTYMTNQHVSREDARTLVEYLRWEAQRGPER